MRAVIRYRSPGADCPPTVTWLRVTWLRWRMETYSRQPPIRIPPPALLECFEIYGPTVGKNVFRMKMKNLFALLLAVRLLDVRRICGDLRPRAAGFRPEGSHGRRLPMYSAMNIVQKAVNSRDHTTLVAAVKAAGLAATLDVALLNDQFAHHVWVECADVVVRAFLPRYATPRCSRLDGPGIEGRLLGVAILRYGVGHDVVVLPLHRVARIDGHGCRLKLEPADHNRNHLWWNAS